MAIINGCSAASLTEPFSKFVRLSRTLPLVDSRYKRIGGNKVRRGISPKKDHEVEAMIAFLHEITATEKVTTKNVIDVGSGVITIWVCVTGIE